MSALRARLNRMPQISIGTHKSVAKRRKRTDRIRRKYNKIIDIQGNFA